MKIRFSESYSGKFKLDPLPYAFNHLEPIIDSKTMEIHHGKHHQAYVDKLNEALEKHPGLRSRSIEDLLADKGSIPEDIRDAVVNNGGGHFNHSLFWKTLTSERDYLPPSDELSGRIDESFGSLERFKKDFAEAAKSRFGSGWAWLVLLDNGELKITSTANQDSPLGEGRPILGLDVWEHAYYLKYQSKRADYVENFFKIINWKKVEENLSRK